MPKNSFLTTRYARFQKDDGTWFVWDRGKNMRIGDGGLTEADARQKTDQLNSQVDARVRVK